MKDAKSPETTSLSYDTMLPVWRKVATLLGGTKAMREAGRVYLPQHHGENDELYRERLDRNTLLNMTRLTLNNWVGRPFSKPVKFDEVPTPLEELLTDIDLLGNDIQVFSRDWFADGLAKAFSHCYVEFPRTDNVAGVRTLADDRQQGVRPHWIHLQPEQVFFVDAEMIDGTEQLREVRWMEDVSGRDGFAETTQPQIRRMFLDPAGVVQVELYRLADPKSDKREWKLFDSYNISLPHIPLVTFYANRAALMQGVPPLEDLADLNIAHWQSSSEQRAILTVTRFPILAGSGIVANDKNMIIGPNRLLTTPDSQGKIYYVEHSGKSLEAGRFDLESLESQMAAYGAEYLTKKPNPTASARIIDSAEATSPLQEMAIRFGHAVAVALRYTAEWMKLEADVTVVVHTKFDEATKDANELTALRETRKMKDISREAYLTELVRRGVLCEDYDMQEDATLLEDESLSFNPLPLPDMDPEQQQDEDDDSAS